MTQMNCDELNKNFGGIIIVYDHPCKKSLASVQKWLDKNLHMLRQNIIVIGNKLPTKKQQGAIITDQVLRQFEQSYRIKVYLLDIRSDAGVDECITMFANAV